MSDLLIRIAALERSLCRRDGLDSAFAAVGRVTREADWTRRATLDSLARGGLGTLPAASGIGVRAPAATDDVVRIGYQKSSSLMIVLKLQARSRRLWRGWASRSPGMSFRPDCRYLKA